MLFKKELAEKILTGEKTQTRRPVKAGEALVLRDGLKTVLDARGRMKMQVGRDYAVQYGRGKPCRWWGYSEDGNTKMLITWDEYQNWHHHNDFTETYVTMRIRVTDIRREDVREIGYQDGIAEACNGTYGFLETWCDFYDKPGAEVLKFREAFILDYGVVGVLDERPDDLYQAWAYTFELVV